MSDTITFVWYATQYVCYVAIILYVLQTFGIIKNANRRTDLPNTLGDAIKGTNTVLRTVSDITRQISETVNGAPPPEPKAK